MPGLCSCSDATGLDAEPVAADTDIRVSIAGLWMSSGTAMGSLVCLQVQHATHSIKLEL